MILFIIHELVSCFGASVKLFISRQYRRVAAPRVWVKYLHSLLYGSGFTGKITNRDIVVGYKLSAAYSFNFLSKFLFPSFRI